MQTKNIVSLINDNYRKQSIHICIYLELMICILIITKSVILIEFPISCSFYYLFSGRI